MMGYPFQIILRVLEKVFWPSVSLLTSYFGGEFLTHLFVTLLSVTNVAFNCHSFLLMGENVPHKKGGHFPFCKSQLYSRTFGVAGLMGLWTHYHSKRFEIFFKYQKEERDNSWVSYSK